MEFTLIIGVAFPIVAIGAWIAISVLVRRRERDAGETFVPPADRAAALQSKSLHEAAAAGKMTSVRRP
ncbi:hypothetical protein H4J02_06775 [Protaetiibacter sp. SSC-01]|uniref:hypothetical protein n=1 Tax=Protaetiibacter sp. SSC-01 TaxID=2759943 RepID=UPI0016571AD9|nr:hypothetical protein [Protaetiibacter sp. SSC-01]QNO38688.1 hypothetical protein H4J02_06775 [Protaetiibacter sp. SSC-01]